ncbi:uncharacterized protein LOC129594657 [Paramacrobiotus metropolitanus]|uniref:uncharacterized protein LOC129594657 n=1 Tax=Paramacrobiotus metropolitanus TaxID=2943436 RepID=UPI002445D173|nr:uncharacterized protein LOC129594657 [Paramacrobiotus metropolitanus]
MHPALLSAMTLLLGFVLVAGAPPFGFLPSQLNTGQAQIKPFESGSSNVVAVNPAIGNPAPVFAQQPGPTHFQIPTLNIPKETMQQYQQVAVNGVTAIQNAVQNFLTGVFGTFKKIYEKNPDKIINAANAAVQAVNTYQAEYAPFDKEISDAFSQSFLNNRNLTYLFGKMPDTPTNGNGAYQPYH